MSKNKNIFHFYICTFIEKRGYITDHRGETDYKLLLNKIQEVYRLELERVKHSEKYTARIHELLRQQSRARSGSFAL